MDQREESIHYYCQNQYLVQRANETWNQDGVPKININSLQQFSDIFELFDVEESNPVKKMKRATPIVRKEYRHLTRNERERFHRALQAMKADTSDRVFFSSSEFGYESCVFI